MSVKSGVEFIEILYLCSKLSINAFIKNSLNASQRITKYHTIITLQYF